MKITLTFKNNYFENCIIIHVGFLPLVVYFFLFKEILAFETLTECGTDFST